MLIPYDVIFALQDIQGKSRFKVYDLQEEELIEFPNSDIEGMRNDILGTARFQGSAAEMVSLKHTHKKQI